MVTVQQAEEIVFAEAGSYGVEHLPFQSAIGRVLAVPIQADRDLPPYDRVTMDGIAINYRAFEQGHTKFRITGTQAAGEHPLAIEALDECIEIMTGAALSETTDTIVRYEDVTIENGFATIHVTSIKKGQNIHRRGTDRKVNDIILNAGNLIDASAIGIAASTGQTTVAVTQLPKIAILSTGNELVEPSETPNEYQIRRSNVYAIHAILQEYNVDATILHIPDDVSVIERILSECLSAFDAIILSGGISMGKFDHLPQVLEQLHVKKLFYKVQQRPGKPFWFGKHTNGCIVFAFPGNPVSTFLCAYRYFVPWLRRSLGLITQPTKWAKLDADVVFEPQLQYFLQVKFRHTADAQLIATPVTGNGSGDYSNLADADAFMELPAEISNFKKGNIYPVWPYKAI
ncbi:MAG: molybdopterin molybdenumtransferase MoeA [Bacteroidetes bacterium 43-93]|nr:molybdopterin molybdotransferase MoeA [Bacteroidota bacterium]OJW97009.1 MAG: molybdopterin molybdenumtransferase MoeA [Bacteroidetes bacterium 43-93]